MIYRYGTIDINLDEVQCPFRYEKNDFYLIRLDYADNRNPNVLTFHSMEERDMEYIHICELIFSKEQKSA